MDTRSSNDSGLRVVPYTADDGVLSRCRDLGEPTLRLYLARGPQVVLGRGSKPEVEVDLEACATLGIPLARRRGGGCAVLLDPGNVVVSLALAVEGIGGNTGHFARVTDWLVSGLSAAGIPGVAQRGISDLALGDRKIGGACIYRTRGLLLYSATLLVTPDLDLMERCLRHPPREPDYRRGRPHRRFVQALCPGQFRGSASDLLGALTETLQLSDII